MPNCSGCGKNLSSFSFGQLSDLCPECRRAAAPQPVGKESRPSFPITNLILAINLAVFVAMTISGVSVGGGTSDELIRWGADYGPLTLGGQWWRILTSIFVHIGIFHLAVNMWCLWNLGRMAEWHLGRTVFALIYLGTGLGGSLASLLWHPNPVSAGASGALFGLAGALISAVQFGAVSLPGEEMKRQIKSLVPFCIYNLFLGAVVPFIDNAAHLGGLVAGLLFGALLSYAVRHPEYKNILIGTSAVLLVCIAGLATYRNHHVVLSERARACLANGDLECAQSNAEKLLAVQPKDALSLAVLGDVYFRKAMYKEAETSFKRALETEPTYSYPMSGLGSVAFAQSEFEDSYRYFLKAAAAEPNEPWASYNVATPLIAMHRYADAGEWLDKALALKPDLIEAQSAKCDVYLGLKHYEESVSCYNQVLKVKASDYEVLSSLAEAYEGLKRHSDAKATRAKAEALKPK
jgi:membrane associated rhomboid family serine protease/Flp pilus assembly protein TadD